MAKNKNATRNAKSGSYSAIMKLRDGGALDCIKLEATPAPRTKMEAAAQIRKLVDANKASLDALADL